MKKFTYYLGAILIMANVFFTTSCSKDDEDVKKSIEVEVSDETGTSAVVEWDELDDAFMHEVIVLDEDGDEVLEEDFGFDDDGEIVTEIKITGLDKETEYTVTVTAYGLSGDDADDLEKILSDIEEAEDDEDYDEMMDLYEEMSELLEDADGILLGDGSATFETTDEDDDGADGDDDGDDGDDDGDIAEITGIEVSYSMMSFSVTWDWVDGAKSNQVFINGTANSDYPITGTPARLDTDLKDGDVIKVQSYSDSQMTNLIAEGSITYTEEGSGDGDDDGGDDDGAALTEDDFKGSVFSYSVTTAYFNSDGSYALTIGTLDMSGGANEWRYEDGMLITSKDGEDLYGSDWVVIDINSIKLKNGTDIMTRQ